MSCSRCEGVAPCSATADCRRLESRVKIRRALEASQRLSLPLHELELAFERVTGRVVFRGSSSSPFSCDLRRCT